MDDKWILYGVMVLIALALSLTLIIIGLLARRVKRLESGSTEAYPFSQASLSIATVTQSKEFVEAVQRIVYLTVEHSCAGKPFPRSDDVTPSQVPLSSEIVAGDVALTETECVFLRVLLRSAKLQIENSPKEMEFCTILLSNVNQLCQRDYTREDCRALAQKLIVLTQKAKDVVLSSGRFIEIRHIREDVAILFSVRSVDGLEKAFLG